MSELLIESVSSSTQQTYKTGFQAFMIFLLLSRIIFNSNELPVLTEDLLLSFVSYCVNHLHLQYSTIKLYLCRIRYNYFVKTRDTIFKTSALPRVQTALTGIKRLQGKGVGKVGESGGPGPTNNFRGGQHTLCPPPQ